MTDVKINNGIDLNITKPINKKINKFGNNKQKPRAIMKPKEKMLEDLKKQVSIAIDKVGGKYVKFDDVDHTEGLMVAGIIDNSIIDNISDRDKVCFAVMNRDKKMIYINNNEHFSVLQEIPSSLYVLNYLYTREPQTLYDYATDAFEKDKVTVFTKTCINIPKKKNNKK